MFVDNVFVFWIAGEIVDFVRVILKVIQFISITF